LFPVDTKSDSDSDNMNDDRVDVTGIKDGVKTQASRPDCTVRQPVTSHTGESRNVTAHLTGSACTFFGMYICWYCIDVVAWPHSTT